MCRDRVHMLLAALSLMHEQTHQAGNAKRCQLVDAAITHFVKRFRPVLLDNSQQDDAAPTATSEQPAAWQQVRHTVSKYTCPVWAAQCNTWLFIKLTPKDVSLPPPLSTCPGPGCQREEWQKTAFLHVIHSLHTTSYQLGTSDGPASVCIYQAVSAKSPVPHSKSADHKLAQLRTLQP